MRSERLYVLSVVGLDQVGLVAKITGFLFKKGFNIVDIEQSVIHSQFTMVLLVEPVGVSAPKKELEKDLQSLGRELGMTMTFKPLREYKGLRWAEEKQTYLLTILGSDKPGVVAAISSILSRHGCNIDRIKMIARGELLAMEMTLDLRGADLSRLRMDLRDASKRVGMDLVMQPEAIFKKRKKVIVFDMDSTIVDGEVIDEMAKVAGAKEAVAHVT